MTSLHIQMLGEFTLSTDAQSISDRENRSHKVWMLLAYLIYHRQRVVSQEELIHLLWGNPPQGNNPTGALKTALHRVRSTLDHLWPSAGHQLILRQKEGYCWNPDIPLTDDIDTYESLCRQEEPSPAEHQQVLLEALAIYGGDFLSNLTTESWIYPISAYYHKLYLQTLFHVLPLLMEQGRQAEVVPLCQTASTLEPFHEPLHRILMRAFLDLGTQKDAIAVYKALSQRLFSDFGVIPSEETRALYWEAARTVSDHALPIEIIREQLQEAPASGALICDYDFFRVLCYSLARSMARTGMSTYVALLSVTGKDGEALPKQVLRRVMENLEQQIQTNLRKGDAAACCSASQYILMLPQANYENSCMVCMRIIKAFARQYPHSPAEICYSLLPLAPNS